MLSGIVVAIVTVAYCLSFSALIFSGPLSAGLGYGLTAALISAGAACLIVGRLSSIPTAIASPDTPPVAVMAAMAFALASSIAATTDPVDTLGPVIGALVLTTLLTGAGLFLVGHYRLATWMRFIPYPVIAGFLAASGWYLATGAFRVATGTEFDIDQLDSMVSARNLPLWGTSLAFAGVLFLVRRATKSPFAVPIALFVALFVVVLGTQLGGISVTEARAQGWFIQVPTPATRGLPWIAFAQYSQNGHLWNLASSNLDLLIPHLPEMLAVALVTAMAILLNATGIEITERVNVDLDAEMRAAGLANIIVAAGSGIVANLTFNRSRLNLSAGATSRLSAAVCGVLCLLFLLGGLDIVGYVAAPILGGLLFYFGVMALWTWVIRQSRQLDWTDFLLIVSIFILIIRFGYLAGAALGVVASCLFFAFTYSRIAFIRRELTRQTCASYVERSREHSQVLRSQGKRIRILKLQGYIFFGTAHRLVEYIDRLTTDRIIGEKYWIIFDFENVTGSDSSARFSFVRLFQMAQNNSFEIILVTKATPVFEIFRRENLLIEQGDDKNAFETLDLALEHCEESLLADLCVEQHDATRLVHWLAREMGGDDNADRLADYMLRRECQSGEMLCNQGDAAESLYFVASGRVSVLLDAAPLGPLRVRRTFGLTTIGEMGFYRRTERTASVRVDEPTIVYELTREAFETMVREAPNLANALNEFIIRTLADRLTFASEEIAALQR